MQRDDDIHLVGDGWLQAETAPEAGSGPPRRRWPTWLLVSIAGIVIVAVVGAVNQRRGKSSAGPAHSTVAAPSSTPAAQASTPSSANSPAPAVSVTDLRHPLLGVMAGWELFGRSNATVVRIELARGRITRSTIPALRSSGPVSFLASAGVAIVRPIDYVAGYVVPDGQPARESSAMLGQGGPVLPGPDPRHVWLESGDDAHPVMVLAGLDGSRPGPTIPVPAGGSPLDASPDGGGYLLFTSAGGVYDARPGELRRITTGALLAVGPTGWLTTECAGQHRCGTVLIDRLRGARHAVGRAMQGDGPGGLISPDGRTAALLNVGSGGSSTLYLLDLTTGKRRPLTVSVNQSSFGATLAWSPDSRWLFAVTAAGTLAVINRQTAQVGTLGAPLPTLTQLVLRPAAR